MLLLDSRSSKPYESGACELACEGVGVKGCLKGGAHTIPISPASLSRSRSKNGRSSSGFSMFGTPEKEMGERVVEWLWLWLWLLSWSG